MSMLEQIARALWVREWPGSNPDHVSYGQPVWKTMLPHAEAALDALMLPTEGMKTAWRSASHPINPASPYHPGGYFAMIRAAKEGK